MGVSPTHLTRALIAKSIIIMHAVMAQLTAVDHYEVSSLFLYIIYRGHGASLIQLRHAGLSFNSCYPVFKDHGE